MFNLTSLKNHDYAKEEEALANFKEFGAVGVLVRISDKFKRLKNKMWDKQEFVVDESLKDTQMDLAVYAVIMMIITEQEEKERIGKKRQITAMQAALPDLSDANYLEAEVKRFGKK